MISSRLLSLGLGAAALICLTVSRPVQAGGTNYNYVATFTTPTPFLSYGPGSIMFSFNPEGPGAPVSSITGSNLDYSNGWQVNPIGISTFGVTSVNYSNGSVTIGNQGTTNGFRLPVSKWGSTFTFDINYIDPPGPTASDFSVALQSGQTSVTMFDIQFNPNGQETLLSTFPGTTINAQPGTPNLDPVPESSTTISFGLLLALGLGAMAVRKAKAQSARTKI